MLTAPTQQQSTSSHARRCIQQSSTVPARPLVVASKYFTIPWTNFLVGGGVRLGVQSVAEALDATLARLGTDQIDLYQIHFPFPTYSQATLMDGLKAAVQSGKARAVGVCNYDAEQLQIAHDLLAKHDIPIASNQVRYHVNLHSCADTRTIARMLLPGKGSPAANRSALSCYALCTVDAAKQTASECLE